MAQIIHQFDDRFGTSFSVLGLIYFGQRSVHADGLHLLDLSASDFSEVVAHWFYLNVVYVHSTQDIFTHELRIFML